MYFVSKPCKANVNNLDYTVNDYNYVASPYLPSDLNTNIPSNGQMQDYMWNKPAISPTSPVTNEGSIQVPSQPLSPQIPAEFAPEALSDPNYTAGFLKTQIGKNVRVEFLVGTNAPLVDRIGKLLKVGASYILIKPIETDDTLMCDLYSIKFVTIFL